MSRRRVLVIVVVLAFLAAGGIYWRRAFDTAPHADGAGSAPKAVYQCSMHPQVVQDHPGNCPICNMALQRVDPAEHEHGSATGSAATGTAPAGVAERKIKFYRHPMRPEIVSDHPAKDEMGMDYIPVYEEGGAAATGAGVPGRAPFTLSPQRQQLIGVTRGRVGVRSLTVEIRAAGRVAYDPALYRAIVDNREAIRTRGALGPIAREEARAGTATLVRGAYLRLLQQGLTEAQIDAFARADRDPVELLLPGERVWIYAQVYEYEVPLVKPGLEMTVTAPSRPGYELHTTVAAVDAILDPATRTARVRGLVATPARDLRPESFVQVRITVPLGDALAVPNEAVLDTGRHQIVFVVGGEGRFEPRAVTLGRAAQGYYEVLGGLADGDEVVTSANFLIDSESRFRTALAAFESAAGGH